MHFLALLIDPWDQTLSGEIKCANLLALHSVRDAQSVWCSQYARAHKQQSTTLLLSNMIDILPKVYLLHLKVKHCQTLRVVRTFTGQNSQLFDW